VTPGEALVGIMPGHIFKSGGIGVISRSGTLTYEIVDALTKAGLGQSTCVGIGGDPIIGTTFVDCLRLFAEDEQTAAVVVCGEIGGTDEEDVAAFIDAPAGAPRPPASVSAMRVRSSRDRPARRKVNSRLLPPAACRSRIARAKFQP